MKWRNAAAIFLGGGTIALVCLASLGGTPAKAQSSQSGTDKPAQKDPYQRSAEIYSYTVTAKSGAQRGEELYYYKCWVCHNQFAKTGPQLKDLFKRGSFAMSDDPVNEQTLADKIRKGGPGMPAFGTMLKQADIADLLSYIKEGCCFDSHNPPPNPNYRGGH